MNPNYLLLGSNQDNIKDMVEKRRQAHGKRIAKSKLIYQDVRNIRQLGEEGMNPNEISNVFPVRPSQIRGILKEEYWKLPLAE